MGFVQGSVCKSTAEIEDYYCGYRTHIHRAASVLSLGGLL